jgi:hypothetical protein
MKIEGITKEVVNLPCSKYTIPVAPLNERISKNGMEKYVLSNVWVDAQEEDRVEMYFKTEGASFTQPTFTHSLYSEAATRPLPGRSQFANLMTRI